jgi:hypothetical protein
MDGKLEIETYSLTRSASPVMDVSDPNTGENHVIYKCDECKALLQGAEDARDHLWWHDLLIQAPK